MSEKNGVFAFHKNAKGEVIFEITLQNISAKNIVKGILSILLKVFLPIFRVLDFLATRRKLVISSIGLGIGLGISVLITQRPDTIQAFPSLTIKSITNIRAEQLTITSIDLSTDIQTGNVQDLLENVTLEKLVHDERSAELGTHKAIIIAEAGLKNILSNLETVQIGDKITLRGTNKATYIYSVTEIRDMSADYLPNVIAVNDESLILYKSKNILRTQLYMVIAKPVK